MGATQRKIFDFIVGVLALSHPEGVIRNYGKDEGVFGGPLSFTNYLRAIVGISGRAQRTPRQQR